MTTDTVLLGLGDRRATIDHIIPRSRGGSDTFENTLAACVYCNTRKGSSSVDEYKNSVDFIRRLNVALTAPDRLSNEPDSPFYDERALDRGVGVRFRGKERNDVLEYSVPDEWIRVRIGKSFDRRGKPLTLKIGGTVEPYYKDVQMLLVGIKGEPE